MKPANAEIQTSRLLLRLLGPGDLDDLHLIRSDPEVMRFITGVPSTKEQSREWLQKNLKRREENGLGRWAVRFREDQALLGWCGLDLLDTTTDVEVGYGLARRYWGLGIAGEAAEASLRYGFERLNLERIVAVAYPENLGSRRVMEKVGLKYLRNGFYYGADLVYYEIVRADFRPGASEFVVRDNPGL